MQWSLNMVYSLHTMFEGPWLHKTAFPTPTVQPLDESQGSSPLQCHNSWLMCQVALNGRFKNETNAPYCCTANTLIIGKGKANPSSLHTTLEGPPELSKCKVDVKCKWIPMWYQMDHVSWSIGLLSNTTSHKTERPWHFEISQPLMDDILSCVTTPAWIRICWNNIWLRAHSCTTSHYTWGPMTTLHGFESVLGWPLDTFLALIIPWSQLLACVWSGEVVLKIAL